MGRVYQRTFLINVDFLTKVSKRHTLGLGPRPCLLLDGKAWLGSSIAMWSQQTRRLLSGGLILITLRYRAGSGSMLLSRSCAFCFFAFASSHLSAVAGVCWQEGLLAVMDVCWRRSSLHCAAFELQQLCCSGGLNDWWLKRNWLQGFRMRSRRSIAN